MSERSDNLNKTHGEPIDPMALVPVQEHAILSPAEAIAARVLFKLDAAAKNADGTADYFTLVPDEYKDWVKGLAEINWNGSTQYQDRFHGDKNKFIQAMARNWEAKRRTFTELAETGGFIKASSETTIREFNSGPIVALSSSSSQVEIGAGAFDLMSSGASLTYEKIDLRHGEKHSPHNTSRPNDTYLITRPEVGKRLPIYTVHSLRSRRADLTTSPLMSIYRIPGSGNQVSDQGKLAQFRQDVRQSSIHIDTRFFA